MAIQNINIFDLIILLGSIQGILFSIYLLAKPLANQKANFFLFLFLCSFSLNSIYYTTETLGIRGYLNAWDFSPFYCSFLIITSFYFFIHYLVYPKHVFRIKDALLFLPAIFQTGLQLRNLFWVFYDREYLIEHQWTLYKIYDYIDILVILMAIVLLGLSVWKIRKYERDLQNNYAEITDFSLRWLNLLLFFLFGIWILFTIPVLYEVFTDYTPFSIYYPMWIATSILIYWIGYSTYFKHHSVPPVLFHTTPQKVSPKLSDKTRFYHQQLLDLMEKDKPYLNPDLNLQILAEKMELSSGYLSQIINEYEQKNFFNFVNSHRVQSVKDKLNDPAYSHLNLLGIAYESGFKSKSTFNLAFKKMTGKTPSAYKKSL